MSSIDNRVVKMTFDNAQFEKNVGTTLSTLDKLKSALNFTGATKGLSDLQTKSSSFSMEAMANAIKSVSDRFDTLGIIGARILERITDKVLETGTAIAKAVTIEPVLSGLQEYETQINAVQTILANTRDKLVKNEGLTTESEQIERINSVLDDLNKYADMTIYNFTEMTKNIGTFTAAGVELDQAQSAIKGIANLAAVSGSDSNQASRAMYQLSQALASGVVHLQDWNSVVNSGMGGEVFQNAILSTARAKGIEIDAMLEEAGSFRALLNSQDYDDWFTADILLESLEKFTAGSEGFTKDQVKQQEELWRSRGYSEDQIKDLVSQLHILTDAEEANTRALWKSRGYNDAQIDEIMQIGKNATEAATKVKTLTQLISTVKEAMQSGWTQSFEYIVGDFEQAKILWTEISDIMQLYIGKSAEARNSILEGWSTGRKDENGKLLDTEGTGREKVIAGIRNAFQGLFEIILKVDEAWDKSFLHKGMADDISLSSDKLIDLSQKFMDFTQEFKNALISNGEATPLLMEIQGIAESVFGSLRNVYDGFGSIAEILNSTVIVAIKTFIDTFELLKSDGILYDYLSTITSNFKEFAQTISDNVFTNDNLTHFFEGLFEVVKAIFEIKMEAGLAAWDAFTSMLKNLTNDYKDIGTFFSNLGDNLKTFGESLEGMIKTAEGGNRFTELFESLASNIEKFVNGINNSTDFTGFKDWFDDLINVIDQKPDEIFKVLLDIFTGLVNIGESLYGAFAPFFDALLETFKPSDILENVGKISEVFRTVTEDFKINPEQMSDLHNFFKGLFDVIKLVADLIIDSAIGAFNGLRDALGDLLPSWSDFIGLLGDFGTGLSDLASKIKDVLTNDTTGKVSLLGETFEKLGKVIAEFIKNITGFGDGPNIFDKIGEWFSKLDFNWIHEALQGFATGYEEVNKTVKKGEESPGIFERFGKAIGYVTDAFKSLFGNIDWSVVLQTIATLLTTDKIIKFIDFLQKLPEKFLNVEGIGTKFTKVLGQIESALKDWQESLKYAELLAIAAAIGIISYSIYEVSQIDSDKIAVTLAAIAGGVGELLATVFIFDKTIKGNSIKNTIENVTLLLGVAETMKTIATSLAIVAEIDPERVGPSVIALGIVLGEFVAMMAGLKATGVTDTGLALVEIGIALKIVSEAIKTIAALSLEEVVVGLIGITGAMVVLVEGLNNLNNDNEKMLSSATAMILMGVALNIVAEAVKTFASLGLEGVATGLLGVAASMATLVLALNNLDNDNTNIISSATSMILMGVALNIVAEAVKTFADLGLEGVATGLLGVAGSMATLVLALNNLDNDNTNIMSSAAAMILMGVALNIVAEAVTTFSSLGLENLAVGLLGIAGSMATLVIALNSLTNDSATMLAAAASMVIIGEALNIIAEAVTTFASLGLEGVGTGLLGVAGSLLAIVTAINSFPDGTDMIVKGAGLIIIGEALGTIAEAVLQFGSLDLSSTAIALAAMGGALFEIHLAIDSFPEGSEMILKGAGLVVIAQAMSMLAGAITEFGTLDLSSAAIALAAMGGALFEIHLAIDSFPDGTEMLEKGAGLLLISAGLKMVSEALVTLGSLDLESMLIALGGLGGALLEICIATEKLNTNMGGAASMLLIAGAIAILAPALTMLASIELSGLATALVALAGAFIVFGKVAEVIQPSIPAIMGLSGAIALMGIGLVAITAAFLAFSVMVANVGPQAAGALISLLQVIIDTTPKIVEAVVTVVTSVASGLLETITTLVPEIVNSVLTIITSIIAGLIAQIAILAPLLLNLATILLNSLMNSFQELMPEIFETISTFITSILQMIQDIAPELGETLSTLINTGLQVIQDIAPELGETVTTLITTLLQTIQDTAPEFGETVETIIATILQTFEDISDDIIKTVLQFISDLIAELAKYIPEMADSGLKLINGFLKAIAENLPSIISSATDVVVNFCLGITENMVKLVDAAYKMIIGFIDGLAEAIENNHEALFEAIGHLITAIVDAIIDGIAMVLTAGSTLIEDLIENFNAQEFFDDMFDAGANLVQGFINGIGSLGESLWEAACGIAQSALDAITDTTDQASPSKKTFEQGVNTAQGYINGIAALSGDVSETAGGIAISAMDAMSSVDSAEFSPTVTPVLDLTEVQNGMHSEELDAIISRSIDVKFDDFNRNQHEAITQLTETVKSGYETIASRNAESAASLEELIHEGIEVISRLQLVLDTGTLVGEITPQINRSLGNEYAMAERGVI